MTPINGVAVDPSPVEIARTRMGLARVADLNFAAARLRSASGQLAPFVTPRVQAALRVTADIVQRRHGHLTRAQLAKVAHGLKDLGADLRRHYHSRGRPVPFDAEAGLGDLEYAVEEIEEIL